MFAEELSGNASKKRQEEARARRRQLKQQKAKPKVVVKPTNFLSTAAAAAAAPSSVPTVVAPAPLVPETEPTTTTKNTAVQNALQQRAVRQKTQLDEKSTVRIQSFYRMHLSNRRVLKEQASLLSARLKDLVTLGTLLKQKTKADYIPPPATATVLVRQLLFLTRTLPYKKPQSVVLRSHEDVIRVHQVIQNVLLPGILGTDENLDPILPWPPARLEEVLRLALVVAVRPGLQDATVTTIDMFLRALIGTEAKKARPSVVEEARHYLFPVVPLTFLNDNEDESLNSPDDKKQSSKKDKLKPYPHQQVGATLDLLLILRHHLLFAKGDPIPKNSSRSREDCYSKGERGQSDVLFILAVDGIMSAPREPFRHHNRFLTEILTVPLLTWKTSVKATTKLLSGSPKPILLSLLNSFTEHHAATLSAGKLATLLPMVDVPLTSCPATNTQCLLANLIQVGRVCQLINGSEKTDYQHAALFFNFIATLLDVVPLGTLSTARESAVEWISDGKSHLTAVVLSPVVLEQCKYLLLDSYVRDLFTVAIDDKAMKTDETLLEKTDKDVKQEKDLSSNTTAASLAAKEARVDRSKGFWKSAKWAKNIKSGVSKMLAGDDGKKELKPPAKKGPGRLMNTSAMSKKLANGSDKHIITEPETPISSASSFKRAHFDPAMYFAICRAYGIVLARWGGGGRDDIVGRRTSEDALRYKESQNRKAIATLAADPCTISLRNVLSFSTSIVRTTWAQIQSNADIVRSLYSIIDESKGDPQVRLLDAGVKWGAGSKNNDGAIQLLIFLQIFLHTLIVTDDVELHDMDKPIPLHQLRRCIQVLKKLLYRACCTDVETKSSDTPSNYLGLAIIAASAKTMKDMYDRSSRRPLCLPKLWIVEDLMEKDIRRCKTFNDYEKLLSVPVLRICPFLVSFKRRLKLFERIVTTNKIEIQGQHNSNPFSMDPGLKPGIPVRIMRGRVLEDGLATMNNLGKNMRQRIVVHYLNEAGTQEIGVDVGGLFKEFWTDLCAIAFDPNYALFRVTEDAGNCMYPNPASGAAHGSDHVVLFEFLGRILGKALYEGITIQPQFAHFFLSFLRGDYNFLHMLPDLSTMDPQLYNNLMFLKNYDGDATDLCLTFTIANDDFGGNREIPLIPNGGNIEVTNTNKQRYIGLVAKYRVCDRLKEQSQAFTRGLWDVIERPWLRLFNEPELQVLISGPVDGGVDVDDMRANTRYAGGFTGLDRTVHRFWNVMASFTSDQQACMLRFVTSCERPPPLGFASMNPPFTIQRVGILRDSDKLPTASTCFNTLKLPTYSSEKVLRERLLYAIESGAGFELS